MSSKPLLQREARAIEDLSAFLYGIFETEEDARERVRNLMAALIATMNPPAELDDKAWTAADKKVNRLLAAYTTVPVLNRDEDRYSFVEQTVLIRQDFALGWLEARAVGQVIYLANQGVLHQLVPCGSCSALFLPIRSGQKNCGAVCSKKAYESRPGFKEHRREWQRNHYAIHEAKNRHTTRGK